MKRFETYEDPDGLEELNNINEVDFRVKFKRLFSRDDISDNLSLWKQSLK